MDTTPLRHVVEADGPFVSVYFDSSHNTEDAEERIALEWRSLREELANQGASTAILDALQTELEEAGPDVGRAGRALIGAGDRVLLHERLPVPPPTRVARYSPAPYLLPLVRLSNQGVPHVVVVVDRVGAELLAVDRDGETVTEASVSGREHPVHKVRGGGWAHRRMQQHAENVVKHNIEEVAEETDRLVRRLDAPLLVLAGEVRARSELHDALPTHCRSVAVEVEVGQRAAGGDPDALDNTVDELVNRHRHLQQQEVIDRFRTELERPGGQAVEGLDGVTTALREANAEVLLIGDLTLNEQTTWVGSDPAQVSINEEALRFVGSTTTSRQRADEAVPKAAVVTGCDLLVGDEQTPVGHLRDNVGVLLRHL
ncbi:Rv2629 family ribosome hibernation factor [Goodfellowiella coeruleoviolacea]|uniref:Peptide chain release factor 1 n=1 Tax=Goodfellowiella coeruleoviolacea TaxID=334858 RepID=A0AAE3KED2_9PSEU|nr:Vms1/Ankzf1 family peptidyl-tRNA hydrolase [Goodfellowiella coeruleoviolacea]MCP2163730.1 hypothetical protein [Goodfellowiella coeruleoviolacea]